jgi:site-specific recombinase XerD
VTALAPVLEAFFTERLAQRRASPHTVASYRDTFCLLLRYALERLGKPPSRLDFTDLDAPFIGAFLRYLEAEQGNSIATQNNRLAAIHSLFSYAALRCPEHAALTSRVLAIPSKRADTTLVSSSPQPRPPRCSPPPTEVPGSAAATTSCSWSRSRPGCGSPS